METSRKSRLFTLPADLLLVEEEVGIVLPTLTEAQRVAQEEEVPEDDDDEEKEPVMVARLFVGLPVSITISDFEEEEPLEEAPEEIAAASEPVEAPLFQRPAPPPIMTQLPAALRSPAALDRYGNRFTILEIVDEDGFVDEDTEDGVAPVMLRPPAPMWRSLRLALVAALVLLAC